MGGGCRSRRGTDPIFAVVGDCPGCKGAEITFRSW